MLAASAFLAACGAEEDATEEQQTDGEDIAEEAEDPLLIYTTLYPLEDFAKKVGGEQVEVENIVPVGADAHTFEPTAQQMISVADGDLFVYNGAGFEGFASSIKDVLDGENVKVIEASAGVDLIDYDHDHNHGHEEDEHGHEDDHDHGHEEDGHGHEEDDHGHEEDEHGHEDGHDHGHEEDGHGHEEDDHGHEEDEHGHEDGHDHGHGDQDPHVWLDPVRAVDLAENIKEALIELRPESEEYFTENFEELERDLLELDVEFQEMSDNKTKETVIVSHAGYGYWDDRYGIHQVGISGLSPNNEPSIQQVQETITFAEDRGINYIMFEQNIPTNIAETVREQIGAEDLWLHNLEALTEEDVENEEDYFSLMRRNIEVLETALHD
ncbi:ABC transporter substrate-binding protein [Alteribacter keqinensis]|uniref:ABC transporter substrate-binding protein n=2 Tax=Alteribacter keqinensis TaxID=2483800 RepID=A0A3M7U1M2_9BACI|nr:ABC transporter substrate-binding protein [Alteribacter keqinensis]